MFALACLMLVWASVPAMIANYADDLIPRFNIPRMTGAPKINGTIDPAEWREAIKLMGMVSTGGPEYKDRPASLWFAWDPLHLYIAYRIDWTNQD